MLYKILTDLVIVLHMLFILFAVFGGLLVLWRRWVILIHLPAAIWGVLVEVLHLICPLTAMENYFRQEAGISGYSGGFVEQYLIPIIYPQGLTPSIQWVLGTLVLITNVVIYTIVYSKRKPKLN